MFKFSQIAFPIQLTILILCICGCQDINTVTPLLETSEADLFLNAHKDANDSTIVLKRTLPSENDYEEIFNKNLFNKDRSFVETEETSEIEPTATPTKTAVDLPNIVLVGTLTSESSKLAFIKDMKAKDRKLRGKVVKYSQGEWIGDYLVSEIDSNKVTLTRGEELAFLRLKPPENIKTRTRSKTGRSRAKPQSNRSRGRQSAKRSSSSQASRSRGSRSAKSQEERKREMEREEGAAYNSNKSKPASSRTARSRSGGSRQRTNNERRSVGRSGS